MFVFLFLLFLSEGFLKTEHVRMKTDCAAHKALIIYEILYIEQTLLTI